MNIDSDPRSAFAKQNNKLNFTKHKPPTYRGLHRKTTLYGKALAAYGRQNADSQHLHVTGEKTFLYL